MLGIPDTNNSSYILTVSRWLLCSIKSIIGKNGNIFVPTYSYSFAKKKYIIPRQPKQILAIFLTFF